MQSTPHLHSLQQLTEMAQQRGDKDGLAANHGVMRQVGEFDDTIRTVTLPE